MGIVGQVKSKKQGKKAPAKVAGSLKEVETRRRQVFKPVLDNPYTQQNVWPFVEPQVATTIFEFLGHILKEVKVYNELEKANKGKPSKGDKPKIFLYFTFGFNLTVAALERQAQKIHKDKSGDKDSNNDTNMIIDDVNDVESAEEGFIEYVFVCKFDITPALLIQHFPLLCVSALKQDRKVKLIQLPKGASKIISEASGIDNTTIMSMKGSLAQAQGLYELIQSKVADVKVEWLQQLLDNKVIFQRQSIKILSTSAPILPKKNDQKAKKKENQKAKAKTEEENKPNKQIAK